MKRLFIIAVIGFLGFFPITANATLVSTFAEDYFSSDSDTTDQGTIVSAVYYDPSNTFPEASAAASSQGSLAVASYAGSRTTSSSAEASWSNMFTNETAIDQLYALDFSVSGGYLDIWFDNSWYYPNLGYSIDILLDDSSVWSSSAEIVTYDRTDESWAELQQTGTDLGGTFVSTYYYDMYVGSSEGHVNYTFNPYQGTIDIGKISAGDSFSLQYTISVYITGASQYADCYAYLGNPVDTPFSPGFSGSVTAAPVPEPATMLLFGTGLAGLAGSRLRKKKK